MKEKNHTWDVLGLGTIVVDHLLTLPGELEPDIKHEVDGHRMQVGGPVPTALVLLQRWGLQTSFIGGWCNDAHGSLIEKDLAREGVHADFSVRRDHGQTGFAHVWLDSINTTRTIAYHRSSDHWNDMNLERIPWPSVRILHLDGWPNEHSLEAAKEAKSNGCLVSLDTGSVKPSLSELIPLVDVMNCSLRFVKEYLKTDDAEAGAKRLAKLGPKCVTVTDGANGAWMATNERVIFQPAYPVDAVDTTGAGDTFAGAVIYGVLHDWQPGKILKTACSAAALKCRHMGNRDALPLLQEALNTGKS